MGWARVTATWNRWHGMGEGDGDMEAMPGLGVRWYGEDREETWRKCEGVKRGVTGRQRKASKRSLGKILDLTSQAGWVALSHAWVRSLFLNLIL